MQQQEAHSVVTALTNGKASRINVPVLEAVLANIKSTTFATLVQSSQVKIAKKHGQEIYKITQQQITLNNGKSSLYVNAVNRECEVEHAPIPSKYDSVNGSYSLCTLKSDPSKQYIQALINKCNSSIYYCMKTQQIVDKTHVAQYLGPKAAELLLNPPKKTEVKHAGIEHSVQFRVFALVNIYSLNINKQKLLK